MQLIAQEIKLPTLYTVPPDAIEARDKMVSESQYVQKVETPTDQAAAVASGQELQRHIKEVQETRLYLAAPLNSAAKKLIALENEYLRPLIEEKDRLGRLVSTFQRQEQERVAREEQARRDEVARLDKEKAELEAKAERARKPANAVKLEQRAYEVEQQAQDVLRAPAPVAVKANGARTGRKLRYRVTDMAALYAARPELCTVTEKASAINAVCDPARPVPGLELWWEDKTSFTSK